MLVCLTTEWKTNNLLRQDYELKTQQLCQNVSGGEVSCTTLRKGNTSSSNSTISDNNIGQWLAFPPYPLPNVVLQVQKNIERKVDIIVATLKEGKGGEGFLLRVARDFWLGLYSLYMLGISMGLFQACHVIDFQKDII